MSRDFDARAAGWEAQLDRLDDDRLQRDGGDGGSTVLDRGTFDPDGDGFGFHITDDEDDDQALDTLADDGDDHGAGARTVDVLEQLVTAFNHRDLEDLLEVVAADGEAPGLLGYDAANLATAIADLWERRPSVQLTKGRTEEGHLGVLWEHDGAAWWQLAAVCVDDVVDGRVGVLEFADDPDLLDRIRTYEPDEDLLEGERWEEWEEGTDG